MNKPTVKLDIFLAVKLKAMTETELKEWFSNNRLILSDNREVIYKDEVK